MVSSHLNQDRTICADLSHRLRLSFGFSFAIATHSHTTAHPSVMLMQCFVDRSPRDNEAFVSQMSRFRRESNGQFKTAAVPSTKLSSNREGCWLLCIGTGKCSFRTTTSDAFPDFACGTLWLTVKNFVKGEPVADALKNSEGVKEVGLAAGVGADEDVHGPQSDGHVLEALEILDGNLLDHMVHH